MSKCDRALQWVSLLGKILIFPWGIYELVRFSIQRLLMMIIYPAQSSLRNLPVLNRLLPKDFSDQASAAARQQLLQDLTSKGWIVRLPVLARDDSRYQGLMVINPIEGWQERPWAHVAVGVWGSFESTWGGAQAGTNLVSAYVEAGYNVLMINGPGVAQSEGIATGPTIGQAQELGLQFLETALKARCIVLMGYSMGGGALAEAVRQHDFKIAKQNHILYLANFQLTFATLSGICATILGAAPGSWKERFAHWLIRWTQLELSPRQGVELLLSSGYPVLVTQAGSIPEGEAISSNYIKGDSAIPKKASLAHALLNAPSEQAELVRYTLQTSCNHADFHTQETFHLLQEMRQKALQAASQ